MVVEIYYRPLSGYRDYFPLLYLYRCYREVATNFFTFGVFVNNVVVPTVRIYFNSYHNLSVVYINEVTVVMKRCEFFIVKRSSLSLLYFSAF